MHNFIQLAKEDVPRLENALKKIDTFLNHAPEGCLKWQNRNGKTYYYQQFMKDNKWVRRYIKKGEYSLAKTLAQKHYYILIRPILEKKLDEIKFSLMNNNTFESNVDNIATMNDADTFS